MEQGKITHGSKRAFALVFLTWLVYSMSYLGKVNYSANISEIIEFYGITKSEAGIVSSFFFLSYGAGQVFNGLFCKKYNIKWIIFTSLILSACINLAVGVSYDFSIIKWLWLLNGFLLSMLWPTLIRLLSEELPKEKLSTACGVMGTTVAIGTLTVYALSSLFVSFDKFKLSFYTAGIVVIIVAFIWILLFGKIVKNSGAKECTDKNNEENKDENTLIEDEKKAEHKLLYVTICTLCFFAIGVNLIKDGLTTWVPSILQEEFSVSDSLSILLTLFLPVLAVFGNILALKMHKMIPDYISHCGTVFTIIAILIIAITGSLSFEVISLMLVGLITVNFLASSLNNLITSMFPLFMRGKVNSGMIAGVLNGFCYLGSALSSYGLGKIADNFGWGTVFDTLMALCALFVATWIVYLCYKRYIKKYKKWGEKNNE